MAIIIRRGKVSSASSPGIHPNAQKFKRIFDMGAEKRAALDYMFIASVPVSEIIHTLHNEWKVFTDVKVESLSKYLYRYKWAVIDKGLIVRHDMMKDKIKAAALTEVMEQFDVLSELSELITAQKTRVRKLLTREKDMPMLFSSLGGEMKTLAAFLQQYADTSFDLGTLKRAPQITKITQSGSITRVESEGRSQVSFNLENSAKVEEAANEFFRVLEASEDDVQSL